MPTRKELLQTKIDTNLASGTSITAVEHRDVESSIMNAAIPANRGWFSGLNVLDTPVGTGLVCGLDITSAVVASTINFSSVLVSFTTPMPNLNYIVKIYIQSTGNDVNIAAGIGCPVFRINSVDSVYIDIKEIIGGDSTITVHLEVVSLDY